MGKPLTIDGVSVSYGDVQAVRSASLTLAAGEIGCLLGPSGCGKTTLLRAISGFEPVTSGTIAIGQTPVSGGSVHLPPEQRRVGMVFQDFALFPHLNVERNVAFGLRNLPASERKGVVERVLSLTGMAPWAQAMPHELSGGQQQRVALARALAPEPDLLLLDEPFSSLDSALREQIAAEVRELLLERGVTALMVTHDQQEAMVVADQITLMNGGAVEQTASPYELYHCPATEFAASFIGRGSFIHLTTDEMGIPEEGMSVLGIEAGRLPANSQLKLLLRPDDLHYAQDGSLSLPVIGRAFEGAYYRYDLALPDGQRVNCIAPSHIDVSSGEQLRVSLDLRHLVFFPFER